MGDIDVSRRGAGVGEQVEGHYIQGGAGPVMEVWARVWVITRRYQQTAAFDQIDRTEPESVASPLQSCR